MIEKLDLLKMFNERQTDAQWNKSVETTVNLLIDAVNELQKNATISKMEKVETRPENVQDKFVEQRKWIGKLCWFWDDVYGLKTAGVLEDITTIEEEFHYAKKDTCTVWKHCKPVKPDSELIYHGE